MHVLQLDRVLQDLAKFSRCFKIQIVYKRKSKRCFKFYLSYYLAVFLLFYLFGSESTANRVHAVAVARQTDSGNINY